jgi:hypothetical protein
MPNIGDLASRLISLIGDAVGSSSARLGPAATASILFVLLALLALLARPVTRWTTRDLGRLAALPRSLAIAAEAGAGAAVSLGTAGVARSTSGSNRLQTLAALPLLGHLARAAARAGIPLEVTSNDPLAVHLASAQLAVAYDRTGTVERAGRSRVAYVGEGRATEAARALAGSGSTELVSGGPPAVHGMSLVVGGVGEEGLLLMMGAAAGEASTVYGTTDASQASSVLLSGEGTLIGPELYDAVAELRPGPARAGVLAGNRLIWLSVAVLVAGSLLQLAGVDISGFLIGRS